MEEMKVRHDERTAGAAERKAPRARRPEREAKRHTREARRIGMQRSRRPTPTAEERAVRPSQAVRELRRLAEKEAERLAEVEEEGADWEGREPSGARVSYLPHKSPSRDTLCHATTGYRRLRDQREFWEHGET